MPKKPAADADLMKQMFPDLDYEEEPETKPAKPTADPTADLNAQLARLNADLDQMKRETAAVLSQPLREAEPQFRTELDMTKFSDDMSAAEYAKALAAEVARTEDARREKERWHANRASEQSRKIAALWEDFKENFEDYTDEEKISIAAEKAVSKARDRNLDVEKYMFGTRTRFFNDVAKEYDRLFGEAGSGKQKANPTEPDDERTGGLAGGLNSGRSANRATPDEEAANDMFSDLREVQIKGGWHQ